MHITLNTAAVAAAAAAILLSVGKVEVSEAAGTCDDGVLFVPHTNPFFDVPSIQAVLEKMLGSQGQTERLLGSVDSGVNPTFPGGLKSYYNTFTCLQHTNAGLFYWPDGSLHTDGSFYYEHDRSAMLTQTAGGVDGCASQYLVLHPEFKNLYSGKSLLDVPEYVREGIRVWVGIADLYASPSSPSPPTIQGLHFLPTTLYCGSLTLRPHARNRSPLWSNENEVIQAWSDGVSRVCLCGCRNK
jgi:hypothetical protein